MTSDLFTSPQKIPTSEKPLTESDSYKSSEEWRRICEARYLLSMPLFKRRQMLGEIARARGLLALDIVKIELIKEFERRKNETATKHMPHD